MSEIRTRWAAVGAAVAITLGAGGIGLVSATDPSDAVTFVPITPCRLFDTRPAFQVGDRSAPLGPGDVHTVEATGDHGDCTGIPADATAVSMNMTSTDATAPTFLTVWAADDARPEASSMNPVPGAPAVPNGIISALNGDGEFSVYNLAGSVHVLADINGYYTDHDHDDRYYTKAQTGTQVDAAIDESAPRVILPEPNTGSFFDFTYTAEANADLLEQTFTTDTAGVLDVTAFANVAVSCTLTVENNIVFITIDGVPIRSSSFLSRQEGGVAEVLSGITEFVVPAGDHTLGFGAECRTESSVAFFSTQVFFSLSSIVLYPSP